VVFRRFTNLYKEEMTFLGCRYVSKGKAYPTLVAQVTDPDLIYGAVEEGQETTELVNSLNTWKKDRWFVVLRVLEDTKTRVKMSFLDSEEYFSFEVYFSGREDHQNSKESGDEALGRISLS